jgi:hypothetical protein
VVSIFEAVVEERDGDEVRVGEVMLQRGALTYRAPSGGSAVWRYDAEQGRYVGRVPTEPGSRAV